MVSNSAKIAVGVVLLVVSSALILGAGLQGSPVPVAAAAVASLGLAAGSLLVGTSEGGRPV